MIAVFNMLLYAVLLILFLYDLAVSVFLQICAAVIKTLAVTFLHYNSRSGICQATVE